MKKKVTIFTDGACRGNPGPGGWGALLCYGEHRKTLSGAENNTTNNRMELMAAIAALRSMKEHCEIELYTDSEYVRKGISLWMETWKKNGWKTAGKKAVKNQDLWELLDLENQRHEIHWHWVRGHNGHPENELVDSLAREAINSLKTE